MKKPIVIALDGKKDFSFMLQDLFFDNNIKQYLGYIKLNDAVHLGDPLEIKRLLSNCPGVGFFLDLKLADTNGTDVNILGRYLDAGLEPDILTVSCNASARTWKALRQLLPNTKLALVSFLTDATPEECQIEFGMPPEMKILKDIHNANLKSLPGKAIDAVVCSPLELDFLAKNTEGLEFIVPGIRDYWTVKGQQERTTGIREALNRGASYVVMGSQLTNSFGEISVEESRRLTVQEIEASNYPQIDPDPIQTLINYGGFYESPIDDEGKILGPLVAYAGHYGNGQNYVGTHYFNLATVEQNPKVRQYYAKLVAKAIKQKIDARIDVVVGAPMGGILLASALGVELNANTVFAEKKVTQLSNPETGIKEASELVIARHEIKSDSNVLIIEDLCNNFSTTDKLAKVIESFGANLVGIACIVNRSEIDIWNNLPVIAPIHKPTAQYRQDDPIVCDLVNEGKVVWKPKHHWLSLKEAMNK